MDNFDLKKFLTENRLTKKYQFLNEGVSNKALESYLNTALWSSAGEEEEDLDANYDTTDISKECKEKAKKDLEAFYKKAEKYLEGVDEGDWAHDFWLTRNRHGAGFWDGDYEHGDALTAIAQKFDEIHLVAGDDGQIHDIGGEAVEESNCSSEDKVEEYDKVAKLRKATKKLQELIKLQKEGNKQYPETSNDAEAMADEYEEEQEFVASQDDDLQEEEGMSYNKKLAVANKYLGNMIGMRWDDLADINSLHDAETLQDIKELCDERLEEEGFSGLFESKKKVKTKA